MIEPNVKHLVKLVRRFKPLLKSVCQHVTMEPMSKKMKKNALIRVKEVNI